MNSITRQPRRLPVFVMCLLILFTTACNKKQVVREDSGIKRPDPIDPIDPPEDDIITPPAPTCSIKFAANGAVAAGMLTTALVTIDQEVASASIQVKDFPGTEVQFDNPTSRLISLSPQMTATYLVKIRDAKGIEGSCEGTLEVLGPPASSCNANPLSCLGSIAVMPLVFGVSVLQVTTIRFDNIINVNMQRACSVNRRPKNQGFLFFEEAQAPILTVESPDLRDINNGFGTLAALDLGQVNLLRSQVTAGFHLDLEPLRQAFPYDWENRKVEIWVCEDVPTFIPGVGYRRTGKCSDKGEKKVLSLGPEESANDAQKTMRLSFRVRDLPRNISQRIWSGRGLTKNNTEACDFQYSPLVLNFGDGGVKTSPPETNGVWFDMKNTGEMLPTGWLDDPQSAFLVLDRNGNGNIDNGGELFGPSTLMPNGQKPSEEFANGFEALRQYDSNGDNLINSEDPIWTSLKLWFDIGSDGAVSDPDAELKSLESMNVESIQLDYQDINLTDEHGNTAYQQAIFTVKPDPGGPAIPKVVFDIWFRTQ